MLNIILCATQWVLVVYLLYFLIGYAHGMWKFPGWGLNPRHGSAQSLTCCATRELPRLSISYIVVWIW